MLRAILRKSIHGRDYYKWSIYFRVGEADRFIGNVYPSPTLTGASDLKDCYELFYCAPPAGEIIRMIFANQYDLMKFLNNVGNELRAEVARRTSRKETL